MNCPKQGPFTRAQTFCVVSLALRCIVQDALPPKHRNTQRGINVLGPVWCAPGPCEGASRTVH